MKVTLDRRLCKNSGNCYQAENSCFSQSEVEATGTIITKVIELEWFSTINRIASSCPNSAIIIDDEGLFKFSDVGP